MARIEGEKLWLTLGDKESFAREAEAKGRLWHAAREENEELKNKLKEARAETRKYQRADDGFSALASKFGQEVEPTQKNSQRNTSCGDTRFNLEGGVGQGARTEMHTLWECID